MKPDAEILDRIRFLVRVIGRECAHLKITDSRLFEEPFTKVRARALDDNVCEAESVEAFVSRFGRLQDTLGHKLLPVYLQAVGEQTGAMLDNLDRAERLGLVPSADRWFAVRRLRNQMIHECIEDPEILANALQSGHEFVPELLRSFAAFEAETRKRGWLDAV